MQKDLATSALALTAHDRIDAGVYLSHILVVGQTGSGKTSAVLASVLKAAMKLGAGMLCCCFKADSAADIIAFANETGRSSSILRWNGRNYRFNPIQYALSLYGVAAIGSVVQLLCTILEIIRTSGPMPGRAGDEFWTSTTWNQMANSIAILFAATGTVRIADLLAFLRSAPQSAAQVEDEAWRAGSFFFQTFHAARGKLDDVTFQRCLDYWQNDFCTLDQKTRSNIHISVVTSLAKLNQGILHDAFCTDTNLVPELCMHGAIILMDTPPAVYGEDGIILQKIFKYCWQEAMLLRPALVASLRRRMCLLVADEAQEFYVGRDGFFLATCRSARVGVIYLTQSIPTLTSRVGGDHPQDRVHDLLSHFNTKVFLANSCPITNKFASDMIGRTEQWRDSLNEGHGANANHGSSMGEGSNWGTSSGGGGGSSTSNSGGWSVNSSWNVGSSTGGNDQWNRNRGHGTSHNRGWSTSQTMDVAVEPAFFAQGLRTGGHANGGVVTAIWFQSGRRFAASATNYVLVEFRQ